MNLEIRQILAPVDLGDSSRPALRVARLLAERFGAGITALYVDESLTLQTYDSMFSASGSAPDREDAAPPAGQAAVDPQVAVAGESPARAIVRAANRSNADLIVMGTHSRRGLRRFLDGSVAETVLRTAGRPVLVVPEISANAVFSRIVCAIDGSDASRNAARFACNLSDQFGAELVFARIGEARVPWTAGAPHRAEWREVSIDRGAHRIFACARDLQADLLVVGSQQLSANRSQIDGGLSADDLIRLAPCAILDVASAFVPAIVPQQKRALATA